MDEWWSFLVVALAGAGALAATANRLPPALRRLLWIGFALRVVGSVLRYEVLFQVYDGVGDASGYFSHGWRYASALWDLDLSIFDESEWLGGRLWGTTAVRYLSGFVLVFIGQSMRAEFLAFALLAFGGLTVLVEAVRRRCAPEAAARFTRLVCVWPSLFFWPSSVGKEALIICAVGLVVGGAFGWRGLQRVVLVGAGLLLAFAVRPHMALALVGALAAAEVLSSERTIEVRALGGFVVLGAAYLVAGQLGLDEVDLDDLEALAENFVQLAARGQETESGGEAIVVGVVTILFRPFVWEAHNVMALLASVEVSVLWVMLLRRRRDILAALGAARADRLVLFAALATGALTLLLVVGGYNLGIVARQRTILYPLLFIILEARARRPEQEDQEAPGAP